MILQVETRKAKRLQISPTASVRPFVTENREREREREVSLVWCMRGAAPGKKIRWKNIRADFVTVSRNPELAARGLLNQLRGDAHSVSLSAAETAKQITSVVLRRRDESLNQNNDA